ncbi:cell division protein FtsL [Variovorax sp.]|uniref:cell division protein FtsL n=1 Tax=Variovorax sp. TaxID=1871043 RepID=UPI002D67700A|nr:cell division protein FtsL [Variovorax sp.]HYP82192.1 cell division protein FtsL [Variovorax sp.]
MTRLNLLLLMAVVGSALYLVHIQYTARQLYSEMHRLELESRRLELETGRLQVEKRAQATPLRVEKLAREQLKMRTATPAITLYVRPDGSVIPAIEPPPAPAKTKPGATPARSAR